MNTLPELDWGEETKSLTFTTSSVITHRLGNIDDDGFELSKLAEGCVLELISKTYPEIFPTFIVDLSEGKNTDWDGILGEHLVEIKYSAKSFNNTENRFGNFLCDVSIELTQLGFKPITKVKSIVHIVI